LKGGVIAACGALTVCQLGARILGVRAKRWENFPKKARFRAGFFCGRVTPVVPPSMGKRLIYKV
jgi:hypothetical protein